MKPRSIFIIIAFAAIVAAAIIIYRKYKKKGSASSSSSASGGSGSSASSSLNGNDSFPLKEGSRGNNVKTIQEIANLYAGKKILTEDGIYGPKTKGIFGDSVTENEFDTLVSWSLTRSNASSMGAIMPGVSSGGGSATTFYNPPAIPNSTVTDGNYKMESYIDPITGLTMYRVVPVS